MPKRLKRKILILFVLLVALTTVTSAPSKASRGGVFCDVAPLDSGCYGWICCNDYGGCWCVN